MRAWLLPAVVLAVSAQPAWAQPSDQVTGGIAAIAGVIGGAIAQSRLQRDIATMSAPLEFQSSNIPLDPANPRDPRNFDVAGLRLGMTPDETKRALMRGGYAISYSGEDYSFDTVVRSISQAASAPLRKIMVLSHVQAEAPHSQTLFLDFVILPEGARLSSIRFEMGSSDMSPEAFAAQIARKYGDTAMQDDGDVLIWCAALDGCDGQWAHNSYMRVDIHSKNIQLTNFDQGRDAALAERMEAEIAKRKPQVQEARF